jgi:hypothetical protein
MTDSRRSIVWFAVHAGSAVAGVLLATTAGAKIALAQTPTRTPAGTPAQTVMVTAAPVPALAPTMEPACGSGVNSGETAVLGFIPAQSGTVRIPELNLEAPILSGCFEFRHLTLPRSPMLLSFDISAESLQPAVWANYIVLDAGQSVNFTPQLHAGTVAERLDPCPDLIARPQTMSAALQRQAELCAALAINSARPVQLSDTGSGLQSSGDRRFTAVVLVMLLVGGTAMMGGAVRALRRYRIKH